MAVTSPPAWRLPRSLLTTGLTMSRRHRRRTARGASSVEYALIAVLIAVAIIGVVTLFGGSTSGLFRSSCDSFAQQTEGSAC